MSILMQVASLLLLLVVLRSRHTRRAELIPCGACGMAQLGAPHASAGLCVTCHQRERIAVYAAQAVREIRAQADAAVWRPQALDPKRT